MDSFLNSAGIFYFKKFSLTIYEGVFPVSTDSVLLGSWTKAENAKSILDLGCGAGILSLMLAQKTEGDTRIYAVDIDERSIDCCRANVENSLWNEKVNCFQIDLGFINSNESFKKLESSFDVIISNPPYFHNQLNSPEEYKARSRHQQNFDFALLSKITNYYLNEFGKAFFVIPFGLEEELTYQMYLLSFQLHRIAKIRHKETSDYSLVLLEYGKRHSILEQEEIILFDQDNKRSMIFNELTKDYYL